MRSQPIIYTVLFLLFTTAVVAQDYPATEIYMLDIHKKGKHISADDKDSLVNVSKNKGYDNQPNFIEPLHAIAYVSSRNKTPTDVFLYDLETGQTSQLTHTPEAEFSPKITPDGKYISVVKGSEQNLSRISPDGVITEKLYTSKDSIGYYCWLNENEIAAMVLSKPETLRLINIKNKTEKYWGDSIGRSMYKYKDGVVVCKTLHKGNKVVFVENGIYTTWIALPANTEDYFLTDDGWLFSSDGSKIIYCQVKKLKKGWQTLVDMKSRGISKIFRLAVNSDKSRLAFVTAE